MTMDTKPGFQSKPIGLAVIEATPPSPNKIMNGARASGNGQHVGASSFFAGKPGVKSMLVSSSIPVDRCKECGGTLHVDRGESVCMTCGLVVDKEVVHRPNFRKQTEYHDLDSGYWAENVPFYYRPLRITGVFKGKPFGMMRERATWQGENRSFFNHHAYVMRQLNALNASVLSGRVFYLFFKAKQLRRWADHVLLAASCIFIALREARRSVPMDIMVEQFVEGRHQFGVSAILKCVRCVVDDFGIKLPKRPAGIEVEQTINRLVTTGSLDHDKDTMQLEKTSKMMMLAFQPKLAGRSPFGTAAAVIYMMSKALHIPISQQSICHAANVTEVTLRNQLRIITKLKGGETQIMEHQAQPSPTTAINEPMARLDKVVTDFRKNINGSDTEKRFECEKCHAKFADPRGKANHQRLSKACAFGKTSTTVKPKAVRPTKGYHCDQPGCTRVVSTLVGLAKHKSRKHDIHKFRCPACNTTCDTKESLAQHAKDAHTAGAKKLIAITKDVSCTTLASNAPQPETEPAPWVCGKCGSDWVYKATRTNNKPSAWICFKCNHATMAEPARQCIAPIAPLTSTPAHPDSPRTGSVEGNREEPRGVEKASASERFKTATGDTLDPYEVRNAPVTRGVPPINLASEGVPPPAITVTKAVNKALNQALSVLTVENGVINIIKKPLALGGGLDHAIMIPRAYIKEGLVDPNVEYKIFLIKKENLEA